MRRCLRQEDQTQLPLLSNLRRHWAEGSMSSVMVQELAHSAASQSAHGMESAAGAGHQKKRQPKNLRRDLMTLFGTPRGAPAFTWLRIPMRNGPDFHPVLLPHVFLSELFEYRRSLWEDSIRGPPGATRESWQRSQHWAAVRDHHHLPEARWTKTIPLGLHGDARPFLRQDSAFVISWNELLGAANKGFGQRRLFTVIRKNDLTDATLDALWKVFGWSTNVLLSGILPDRDWSGNEVSSGGRYVAEGWRGSLIQIRGDWEFLCSVFRFPYWNAASNMCWMCSASNAVGRLLWTAVGESAFWRATKRTHAAHVAELLAQRRPVPRCSAWSWVCCRASWSTRCITWTWGSRRTSWLMSSCDASRSGRGEPQHMRRTVNDSTTRPALGTDRKGRSPNSKES